MHSANWQLQDANFFIYFQQDSTSATELGLFVLISTVLVYFPLFPLLCILKTKRVECGTLACFRPRSRKTQPELSSKGTSSFRVELDFCILSWVMFVK